MPPTVAKALSRLSRQKLIDLCVKWARSSSTDPYLTRNRTILETEDEDYLHEPAKSRTALGSLYASLRDKDSDLGHLSKRDIIDRIVDGDWRRGLYYDQLADIDFAVLDENESALRWSALKLVPREATLDDASSGVHSRKRRKVDHPALPNHEQHYPAITAAMFLQNLKRHVSPVVKAHYSLYRLEKLKLAVIRIQVTHQGAFAPISANVPRQSRSNLSPSRLIYIALPDNCPYIYVSTSGSNNIRKPVGQASGKRPQGIDLAAIKRLILEAIPQAFSRPQSRWSISSTKLSAKSLHSMTLLRGGGEVGTTGGALSKLQDKSHDVQRSTQGEPIEEEDLDRQRLVDQRFGSLQGPSHAKLDRLHVKIESINKTTGKKRKRDARTDTDGLTPINISFSGADVLAGLKQFALRYPGYVDLELLPASLTGEQSKTSVTV